MYDVIISNWKIWPAVQLINLGLLPPMYRLPVVNIVATFWNLYISWMNQKGQSEELNKKIE